MTQPLSPQAQAVLDAFLNLPLNSRQVADGNTLKLKMAAAIRALVEQTLPEEPEPEFPLDEHDYCMGSRITRQRIRAAMLAVADELEALP
jgi:hypothetical protein